MGRIEHSHNHNAKERRQEEESLGLAWTTWLMPCIEKETALIFCTLFLYLAVLLNLFIGLRVLV